MITTVQLEECKSHWERLVNLESHHYPFYTHGWHMAWKKALAPTADTLVYSNGDVLISLVTKGNEAHFSGGEEIADYLDCLGQDSKKEAFWKELLLYLQKSSVHKLLLRNVPAHSPTKDILVSLGAIAEIEDMTPTMLLSETDEAYLLSLDRKSRHEFKRKVKKFERSYPDSEIVVSETVDIAVLLDLMKHDVDKKVFLTKEMEAFFIALPTLPEVKTLQATLKTKDGLIIASSIFFVVDTTLLLYNSGFNSAYQGSGFYLKAKTILWAIKNKYREYNFLQGQERYKYELGGKDVPVYKIAITL